MANASHELRTPLTLQRALVEVALADPDADIAALRKTCRQVLAASQDQERLIDALLVLAHSQRGPEETRSIDLASIAGDVLRERGEEITTRELQVVPALAPAPMTGDPQLVGRLVANLVDNAIAYNAISPSEATGWIEVTTDLAPGRATLRVANSGPKVPSDEVASLFEPFRRSGDDRTRSDGLGLGLSIVAAIVSAHAGAIDTRARPEGGLTVEVTFPV